MNLGAYRFKPPWWGWLAYLVVASLLLNLGAWQLRRAEAKDAMITAQAQAAKQTPTDIAGWIIAGHSMDELQNQAVSLRGRYLPGRSLLQDSQVHEGKVGYHLWSPIATSAGVVLVNRGWLPAGPDRSQLPTFTTPLEPQTVTGLWRPLPRPGLNIGEDDCDRSLWPRVVQYPRLNELECLLQAPLIDGILLLAPDQPGGYARDWTAGLMPPAKHYGYALQWFALALALSIIFVWVNTHRRTE